MRTQPLTRSLSGTLDGSGNGTVQLGPTITNEIWLPAAVSIKMTGSTPAGLATCTIYAGPAAADAYFVDATYDVNNAGSSMISGQQLYQGQYVYAVWAGGNRGATATLVVQGTRQVPLWACRSPIRSRPAAAR